VRILVLPILEPLPGKVLPETATHLGGEEAARRYRATILTTLRQLRGIENLLLHITVTPSDAIESVKFWLLPALGSGWKSSNETFLLDGWSIAFHPHPPTTPHSILATADPCCPHLGARWVHTALLGLGKSINRVIGPDTLGGTCFEAHSPTGPNLTRTLPPLPVIRTDACWQAALDGPLGPALKKAWEADRF
jgi:hypothetical protein